MQRPSVATLTSCVSRLLQKSHRSSSLACLPTHALWILKHTVPSQMKWGLTCGPIWHTLLVSLQLICTQIQFHTLTLFPPPCTRPWARSEEHTSELQSRFDLVCRLLLEKKNNQLLH